MPFRIKQRAHNLNNLLLSGIFIFLTLICLALNIFAHYTLTGFATDVHLLSPFVSSLIQFPSSFINSLLSFLLPLILIIHLLRSRRLMTLFIAICSVYLTIFILSIVSYFLADFADILFQIRFVSISVMLIVAGNIHYEKLIKNCWIFYLVSQFILTVFEPNILGQILASNTFGVTIGLVLRFVFGTDLHELSKEMILSEFKEFKELEIFSQNYNKKVYKALTSDNQILRVVVLNSSNSAYYHVKQLKYALKYRNFSFSKQSFSQRVMHAALMNYALYDNQNYPNLQTVKFINDEAVLVFQDDLSECSLLDFISQMQSNFDDILIGFWYELNKAHNKGIILRQITPEQLKVRNNSAIIWDVENATYSKNDFFLLLDKSALLMSLADIVGEIKAFETFNSSQLTLSHINRKQYYQLMSSMHIFKTLIDKKYTYIHQCLEDIITKNSESEVDINNTQLVDLTITNAKRFTVKTIISTGLTVIAVMAVLTQLNFNAVETALNNSNHLWLLGAILVSSITYFGNSLAIYGFRPADLKFFNLLKVQIASGYNQASLPSGVAPLVVNSQYLNKINPKIYHKNTAAIALYQLAQISGVMLMLLFLAAITHTNVNDYKADGFNVSGLQVAIFISILLLITVILSAIPKTRKMLINLFKNQVLVFIRNVFMLLKEPQRLAIAYSGVIIQALGFSLTYWTILLAFGQNVSISQTTLIFLIGNAAGSALPTPGGLGSIETALTIGFTTIGIPPTVALSSTLLYRIITFWLRIPLGYFMSEHLKKLKLL